MSIENTLTDLIAALNANTEALKAAGTAAPAPATRAPRGSKAAPAASAEHAPAPTTPYPEPAKEETPAPAAAPLTVVTKGPTANDLKKFVKDERTRLKDVSDEAFKKHKEESAKILYAFGLTDFTSIPDDKVEAILADFKALNVEQPTEKDELEDDDSDGLD